MKLSHRLATLFRTGREYTICDLENITKASGTAIRNILARMEGYGLIRREMSRAGVVIFSKSPTTGACDPAQPGNPTGTRSDVTTAAPLTGPGALNPLPANGGM
jgi:hypothetical protein